MGVRIPTDRAPTHPGEMLVQEFLKPLGITQSRLATLIGVPFQRVNRVINRKQAVTIDTALRFARLFGTTPDFWLNLQRAWDLYELMRQPAAARIAKIKRFKGAAA
jgi:addiction module HigA family antidote